MPEDVYAAVCAEAEADGVGVAEPDGVGVGLPLGEGDGLGDVAQAVIAASRAVLTAAWLLAACACAAVTALSRELRSLEPPLVPWPDPVGVKATSVAVGTAPVVAALVVAVELLDEVPASSLCNVACACAKVACASSSADCNGVTSMLASC